MREERAAVVALICIAQNGAIARDGKPIYSFPSVNKKFDDITRLYPNIIVGRKTFEEDRFPLDDRFHLVLTNDKTHCPYIVPNVAYYNMDQIKQILYGNPKATFCVMGGLDTYKSLLPYIDRWIIVNVSDPEISASDQSEEYTLLKTSTFLSSFYYERYSNYEDIDKISGRKLKYTICKYIRTKE